MGCRSNGLSELWAVGIILRIRNIVDSGVNTNKTGHHVISYTSHIVESVVKHQ